MPVPVSPQNLPAMQFAPRTLLGTIVATTTKNNHDTASAFNNTGVGLSDKVLMIHPDAACYINFGTANTVTATSSGIHLAAHEKYFIVAGSTQTHLACLSDSGTTNCKVFELNY